MSYYTTHTIRTNYQGNDCDVNYWVEGEGSEWRGYVTDFDQYHSAVTRELKKKNVEYGYITEHGKMKHIKDTKDLQDAVENLEDESVLSVQAFDKTWTGKDKRKRKKKKGRQQEDTDDESEVDDWNVDEPENMKKVSKNYKYVMACIYQFAPQDDWESMELPWDDKVPQAPLGDDYYVRPEVEHLQYLLTRLGHMKLEDTDGLTGSYQSKTEKAMQDFRKKHNITGGDMTRYDSRCQKKLAQVVKKLTDQGHLYLS